LNSPESVGAVIAKRALRDACPAYVGWQSLFIQVCTLQKCANIFAETSIPKAKRIGIGKLNNPTIGGGYDTPSRALQFIPLVLEYCWGMCK
jgi:hypothetical protein